MKKGLPDGIDSHRRKGIVMLIEDMQNEKAGIPTEFNQYNISGSYQPQQHNHKEKKPITRKTIAWACAICVVLSGAFGFGGTVLAHRITAQDPAVQSSDMQTAQKVSSGAPIVIYKAADTASTASTAKATASSDSDMTYAQVAAIVKDSVVEINTEYKTENIWFQYTTGGAGSGVILTEDGYIVTNAHVILDNNQQNVADTVTVRLTDGTEYPAEVKAYDTDEDIAIVKIDAKGLKAVKCGDSDKLVVGQELVIVGNPLGELGGTVTNGIVSATEREIQVGGVTMHLIQTNAAVNPGNSGGGMFNMRGELVGIVNAKSSGTGIEGLGFAIPVNKAVSVSEELMTKGYVSGKPMIGVSFEDVTNDASSFFFFGSTTSNVKPGVYVSSLVEGMNDKVLKEGDRIIAVNGDEIGSSEDIKAAVSAASIGDKLTFQLYRDGKLMEVKVSVYERTPEIMAAASSDPEEKKSDPDEGKNLTTKPAIGVSMQEVNNGFAKEGVYVTALEEGMNDKVLQVGDRIVAVNGDEINSVSDVKSIVENAKIGDKLNFQVSREGKLISVEVTVFEKAVDAEEDAPAKEEETPSESDGFSGFGDLSEFFERFFGRKH